MSPFDWYFLVYSATAGLAFGWHMPKVAVPMAVTGLILMVFFP